MKHCPRICFTICLLALMVQGVQAQSNTPPANYLQIIREEVKLGHGPAHAKTEVGWPRAFAKAKWPTHYVAITSLTGPNEAWYITPWESIAAWEKDTAAVAANAPLQAEMDRLATEDSQHLNNWRGIVLRYRADLSHRPGVNLPTQRFFSITIVRIRPGRTADFEAARKINVDAHVKAGVNDNHSVYQVMSGMPGPTYFIISPMKSLATIDANPQIHGQAFRDAMGDAGRRKLGELAASGTLSAETNYFSFSPEMSYPPPAYVSDDPAFWAPKPAKAPAKAAAKP